MTTTVYTDGACLGNPGPGGWAWAVTGGGPFACGPDPQTTNQRMEISAAFEAVTAIEGPLVVVTDSTYVANCFRDRWWEGWLRNGWKNSAKKPVANRDLWEPFIEAVQKDPRRVQFRWVKGHSGDPMNDLVDRLAVAAATTQTGRTGVGVPPDFGVLPADAPRGRGGARAGAGPAAPALGAKAGGGGGGGGPAAPAGHRVVVAGLRPPGLGGYDDNEVAADVRERLTEILEAKRIMEPDLVVLTGLGLGAEQLGAEAAALAKVPYVAVLPYPGQESVWPKRTQEGYRSLLDGAAEQIVLQQKPPTSKQQAGAALARRDAWLARSAQEAVVVWDHDDDRVGRLVRSLQDHLGEDDVWIVEPVR